MQFLIIKMKVEQCNLLIIIYVRKSNNIKNLNNFQKKILAFSIVFY